MSDANSAVPGTQSLVGYYFEGWMGGFLRNIFLPVSNLNHFPALYVFSAAGVKTITQNNLSFMYWSLTLEVINTSFIKATTAI